MRDPVGIETPKAPRSVRAVGLVLPACLLLAGAAVSGCRDDNAPPPDLVLLHGKIVTLEDDLPEVQALAVSGDRIAALGSDREIERLVGASTRVIDLEGALAIPGLIEGHGHLFKLGVLKANLDVGRAETWEEVVHAVSLAARSTPAGRWIFGRGWHQEKWASEPVPAVDGYPVHDDLTRASPANPVLLRHASGHAAVANALAMERAGVTGSTPDPPGGKIVRDASGRPTGVFIENAEDALLLAYEDDLAARSPDRVEADRRRTVALAVRECLSKGITSFHDAGSDFDTLDLYRTMAEKGELGLRLYAMVRADNEDLRKRLPAYRRLDDADHRLTIRAIKKSIDGALGSRGAWLLEPYSDMPGELGFNTEAVEEIEETARIALEHGFQLCVHAIGDRANREVLDLFQRAFAPAGGGPDLRWRIEHAQHLHPADIPRFHELGVIAAVQGVHCTSDAPFVIERLGAERAREGAYAWRSLIDSGALVVNGTDAPVEDVDPVAGFHASVTRALPDGTAFFPEQRMTREEALRSYTLDAAFAAFEEDVKGSLAVGKLADVTVLSEDILTVAVDEIRRAEVLYTIVGGRVAYRHPDLARGRS